MPPKKIPVHRVSNPMHICPHCHSNLEECGLDYIETKCSNYYTYFWDKNKGWTQDHNYIGDGEESHYECRSCQKPLHAEQQEYFENNI